jgi:GR25 family glycosyltransferase involved in LPS biosynthesis
MFSKVFVITIDKSKNRRKWIEKQLEGVHYEFFHGIQITNEKEYNEFKKNNSSEIVINSSIISNFGYGHLGCFLSHIYLLKKIKESKYENTLILEDDIIFNKDHLQKMIYPKKIPDMLFWGYIPTQSVKRGIESVSVRRLFWLFYLIKNIRNAATLYLFKNTLLTRIRSFPFPIERHYDKSGYNYGTFAYSVSLDGATKLLDLIKEIEIPIDRTYSELILTSKISSYNSNIPLFGYNHSFPSSTS